MRDFRCTLAAKSIWVKFFRFWPDTWVTVQQAKFYEQNITGFNSNTLRQHFRSFSDDRGFKHTQALVDTFVAFRAIFDQGSRDL